MIKQCGSFCTDLEVKSNCSRVSQADVSTAPILRASARPPNVLTPVLWFQAPHPFDPIGLDIARANRNDNRH